MRQVNVYVNIRVALSIVAGSGTYQGQQLECWAPQLAPAMPECSDSEMQHGKLVRVTKHIGNSRQTDETGSFLLHSSGRV